VYFNKEVPLRTQISQLGDKFMFKLDLPPNGRHLIALSSI